MIQLFIFILLVTMIKYINFDSTKIIDKDLPLLSHFLIESHLYISFFYVLISLDSIQGLNFIIFVK